LKGGNKDMDNKSTALLISAFVLMIIGVALIGTIASEEQSYTEYTRVLNETHAINSTPGSINATFEINVTNNPEATAWKEADCPITSVSVQMSNGTALTDATDYVFTESLGNYTLINTSATYRIRGLDNNTYVDYSYCGDDYLNLTWGRNVLGYVPGFFAFAILGIGIGLVFLVLKREGLINV
jgi:hypothetical protein